MDEALKIREEEVLPIFQELGDMHSVAITQEGIASIHEHRGRLDEALRIRNDVSLPIYDKLEIGSDEPKPLQRLRQQASAADSWMKRYEGAKTRCYPFMNSWSFASLR